MKKFDHKSGMGTGRGAIFTGLVFLALLSVQPARASIIDYAITDLGGGNWEYLYTVRNDTLGVDIEEFTIYFDYTLYDLLSVGSTPAGWDPLVIPPENDPFGLDGFYDALALFPLPGIAPGGSQGGFSVTFAYLGLGTPGSQPFEIVDPSTFELLDFGQTSLVPVPAAVWLFGTALIALIGIGRRRNA